MRVRQSLFLLLMVLAAGCGGGPSTADYAEDVEALVTTMNARLDELESEVEGTRDLKTIKRYAEQRVLARTDFVAGLRDLNAPDEVAELHETALEIIQRVTAAETVMADVVMGWDSASDIEAIWETPEGLAAKSADAQAIALCLAAQAEFDQTAERSELEGVPWIPAEMKQVIRVALGCEVDSR